MKASVKSDECIGCGLCADTCPEVFEMDGDNIAKVKVAVVPKEAEAACRNAAEACPSLAIEVSP